MHHFDHILILLACAVIVISVFRRIHLPPILGYLLIGTAIGPGGFGVIPTLEDMLELGEFGVVFLMFTLGLHFSIPRLMAMRKILIGVGGLQVLTCTLLTMLIGLMFGLNPSFGFVCGAALALSSTAVVIKQLSEQKEENKTHGQLAISILLFQDIAAVLFLILIPAMSRAQSGLILPISIAISKGILVFIVLALIGQWILRPLFHEVAKSHSTELFMLAAVLVALSAAWVTNYLELSMALGAFLAGLMLGETEFRHQIELDIRPFKDILLGLFFIGVGGLLELDKLSATWPFVLIVLAILMLLKAVIVGLITRYCAKTDIRTAFRTAIILSQGGELGFLILTQAIQLQIINPEQQPILISSIVLSIVFAPLLIRYNKQLTDLIFKPNKSQIEPDNYKPQGLIEHSAELKDHVIVCGYGRVGQIITRFLEQEKIVSLALDLDPVRISTANLAGENAFFGDATRPETLTAAGLARARMVVISFSTEIDALIVVKHVRSMRLDIPIFVRTKDDSNLVEFQEAGATEVVPESLEGSLMLASHLLLTLGVPASKILYKIRSIHASRYQFIRGYFEGQDAINILENSEARNSLHAVIVKPESKVIGQTISSLSALTTEIKFPIKSLTRNNIRHANPKSDLIIEEGDVLVLYGTPESLYLLEEAITSGKNIEFDKTPEVTNPV